LTRIIELIGHDGSAINPDWAKYGDPKQRVAFHVQELIIVAYRLGYTVTPFERRPISAISYVDPFYYLQQDVTDILNANSGVITGVTRYGVPHAVAWDGSRIHDPSYANIETLDKFQLECFWLIRGNHVLETRTTETCAT